MHGEDLNEGKRSHTKSMFSEAKIQLEYFEFRESEVDNGLISFERRINSLW
jgi:hypothetical protein